MSKSEIEALKRQEQNLYFLEKQLIQGKLQLNDLPGLIEGAIQVNDPADLAIKFVSMSPTLQGLVDRHPEEIISLGEEFLKLHVHPLDIQREFPRFHAHYQKGDDQTICTGFQSITRLNQTNYTYLATSTKIFKNNKGFLTMQTLVRDLGSISKKLEKALDLDLFMRKNFDKFFGLTNTEREILRLLALGHNNKEIADMSFTSVLTVQTHRKNIKRKLGIQHFRELLQYAQAFDLV